MISPIACLTLATDLSELADYAPTLQLTATLAAAAMVADHMAHVLTTLQTNGTAA
jgi:hypothetical protein